jgi:hypothetical protein
MEAGTTVQEPARITKLMKHYGCDQADIDRLARLAGGYADRGAWWADFADVVPNWLETFVGLEGLARGEFVYDPLVLPGPVQVPEYAEALLVDHPRVAASDVSRVVALRMARQERLSGDDPLEFVTVIEETTLDRMVGGPAVMRRQLEHLSEVDQRPHVTLLVMPSVVAVHDGLDGEFMLLDFREAQSIAYTEFQDGAVYVQDPDRVKKYDFRRKRMCSRTTPAAQAIKDRLDQLVA